MAGVNFLARHTPTTQLFARDLDQFFTRSDVAQRCTAMVCGIEQIGEGDWLWLEPSAGGGAFLDHLPYPRIGLDIHSQRADIMAADFLGWHPGKVKRRIAVVGNPPFGKNASLARRFFDHAAGFADLIAFIVPRTFEKPAFVNQLDRRMHLLSETLLDEDSFEFAGETYAVPTIFQIWEKRADLRPLAETTRQHRDFDFVAQPVGDFAFQRVGARAGLVSVEGLRKSPQSHYFIKANGCSRTLLDRLRAIDWNPIKHRTAGNPSIGKAELVGAYQAHCG
jgi:hypothetical protein